MLKNEIASVLEESGRITDWASAVKYNAELANAGETAEISQMMDAWAKELGKTGYDRDHELSALIQKTFTPEVVTAPSELIDRMFDIGSIGEFDDYRVQKDPKNTIKVQEAVAGGNVDRSFIDHSILTPSWTNLQAETDVSLAQLRQGGYKTVSNLVNFINEALEYAKVAKIFSTVDTAITAQHAGYGNGSGSADPTDALCKALALYLTDVGDGSTPLMFALNKYIQSISGLAGVTTYLTKEAKNQYNTTGFVKQYAGCELFGLSGQKKYPDQTYLVPDKRIFGVAGKIGDCITRGETQVLQETNINRENIHIKVGGYSFGTVIKDIDKIGKIVLA